MSPDPFPRLGERRPNDLVPLLGKFPPVPDFTATDVGGHTVNFLDQSVDLDGEIKNWEWDFGDAVARPTASFTFTVNGTTAKFIDTSTDVPPGTVTGWSWNFGDGATSVEQHPEHTYAASGSYNVTLTVSDNDGNTSAVPAQKRVFIGGAGMPFGPMGGLNANSLQPGMDPFSVVMQFVWPEDIISKLNFCRANGIKLISQMADGSHDRYVINRNASGEGFFDLGLWEAEMSRLNTPAIRDAVAAAVADGTLIGNSVMDEPNHHTWNGGSFSSPWMTKAKVDQMCAYAKSLFPTLVNGVVAVHTWVPTQHYQVCDFIISQYSYSKGDVTAFRDAGLAVAAADGVAIAFSINIIDGGIPGATCPNGTTGGVGTAAGRCRVTPAQLEAWGNVLGPAGSGLVMWRYDLDFMALATNRTAEFNLRAMEDGLPAKSWRRSS